MESENFDEEFEILWNQTPDLHSEIEKEASWKEFSKVLLFEAINNYSQNI